MKLRSPAGDERLDCFMADRVGDVVILHVVVHDAACAIGFRQAKLRKLVRGHVRLRDPLLVSRGGVRAHADLIVAIAWRLRADPCRDKAPALIRECLKEGGVERAVGASAGRAADVEIDGAIRAVDAPVLERERDIDFTEREIEQIRIQEEQLRSLHYTPIHAMDR